MSSISINRRVQAPEWYTLPNALIIHLNDVRKHLSGLFDPCKKETQQFEQNFGQIQKTPIDPSLHVALAGHAAFQQVGIDPTTIKNLSDYQAFHG